MDRTRPALVLMRVLLALTSFVYGVLRIFAEDNAFFRIVAGDPAMDRLPYTTNQVWARFIVVITVMIMGYIIARTLWGSFSEYVRQGVETHVAPWSVIAGMVLATFAGIYYTTVALVATVDYRWLWPATVTMVWAVLTVYEVKQHDRYFA
jgi:hypothetical protein